MGHTLNVLLIEKNQAVQEGQELKSSLQHHQVLIHKLEQTVKDLIDLNKQATHKIKEVEAQKAELEADVARQTNLVKDITEA